MILLVTAFPYLRRFGSIENLNGINPIPLHRLPHFLYGKLLSTLRRHREFIRALLFNILIAVFHLVGKP